MVFWVMPFKLKTEERKMINHVMIYIRPCWVESGLVTARGHNLFDVLKLKRIWHTSHVCETEDMT